MAIELPSVLAFERKLEVSDALMYAGDWEKRSEDNWHKVPITKRQNRSTISPEGTSEEDKTKPNPKASNSDDANLLQDTDTLRVSFSLRVIGNLGKPFSCNSPEFEKAITTKINEFKNSEGIAVLAKRYAYNIANARFLWRNRVGADEIEVKVISKGNQEWVFKSYEFSLRDFTENEEKVFELASVIEEGLKANENNSSFINIEAYVKLGKGQHVFPSQEMNIGEDGKVLFQLENCAAMHSVKIGNALRTIDNWHGDADGEPIATEPFGAVTHRGKAYRPSKNDLYSIIVKWVNDKEVSEEDKCYVVANLIRGGLFQKNKK